MEGSRWRPNFDVQGANWGEKHVVDMAQGPQG